MDTCTLEEKNINHYLISKNKRNIRIFDDRLEIDKKCKNGQKETICYQLNETTVEFIKFLRRTDMLAFILKRNGKLYYCTIDNSLKNMKFLYTNLSEYHKCAAQKDACKRLYARPEHLGGCSKVLFNDSGIEDFPWITYGYETINFGRSDYSELSSANTFVVLECEHYAKEEKKAPEIKEEKVQKEKIKKTAKEYRLEKYFYK